MTRYFLSRIRIEGFRGINNESEPFELKFKPDAVNSLFAVNGVGKSSIFEALSYAIRGIVPKLEGLQAQERPEDYYCNRFHSKRTATIELELEPDDGSPPSVILVTRDRTGKRTVSSPSGHANPVSLLNALNEDFTLLDYQAFNRFIDSSPLERGRSFSALLGLSAYSDLRQAIQATNDTRAINTDFDINVLQADLRNSDQLIQQALRKLKTSFEGLTGQALTDVSLVDKYAVDVLAALRGIELIRPHIESKSLETIDFGAVKEAIRTAEGGEKRKELEVTLARILELDSIGASDSASFLTEQERLTKLFEEKSTLLKATRGETHRNLYVAAKTLLDKGEWTDQSRCPLCESELGTQINEVLRSQLDQYVAVARKTEEIATSWQAMLWPKRLGLLEKLIALGIPDEEKTSAALTRRVTSREVSTADLVHATTRLTALEKLRSEKLATLKLRRDELQKELPASLVRLTEQVEYGRQFREALIELRQQNTQRDSTLATLRIRERWRTFIGKAATLFADAEADLAKRRIASIETQYRALFQSVIAVNDVEPELQRSDRREDLNVQLSKFHGQSGVSARALLSESYRNALAISVFLSAATRQKGAPRFIVLDDVTSSFDAGHQWNLMEAIRLGLQYKRNPDGVQFIILSHDGLLEKYFDKLGNSGEWHHQKLQGWPPLGAVMSQTQDANRLRSTATRLLDAGQIKEAEPLIRQYLEFKLLQIIGRVRIAVPLDFAIKDHMKMVSNCLEAIGAEIDLHKKAGTLVLDPGQLMQIDKIHVPALVGNWISHYETASGTSVAPPVLKNVLKTIDEYAECFQFNAALPGAKADVRWYKSLSVKA